MRIIFDSALDGRSWPAMDDGVSATLGEIRVGRLGLLGLLENLLGLTGPVVPDGVRIAALVPQVQALEGFWSKSAAIDPFGVSRELIKVHDYLIYQGWKGQGGSPRLDDLAKLTPHIRVGISTRLQLVLEKLNDSVLNLERVTLFEDVEGLPPLWRSVFEKLAAAGTDIEQAEITERPTGGNDLAHARSTSFVPVQDGSLQLYRPSGVMQAAEDVAAWLAGVKDDSGLDGTVIIGGDAVLDRALHRYGLPVTGAEPEKGNALLQLLPLVLSCGWNPPDPARVLELLTLPVSPVPPSMSRSLVKALEKWPAVGSPLWQKNLAEGLEKIEDQDRRQRVADRLAVLFTPIAGREYTGLEIESRLDMLVHWLQGRFHDDTAVGPALGQCAVFKEVVRASGQKNLDEPLLKKLLDEAVSSITPIALLPAQQGITAVREPEAVTGPVKRVVWWNFNSLAVPSLSQPMFSGKERTILTKGGVEFPDSMTLTSLQAERWGRPLQYAQQQLVLVCPETGSDGEELHPHPLWYEILARSGDKAEALIGEEIQYEVHVQKTQQEVLAIPAFQERWQVEPGSIHKRDKESPSSLENFLGCPLNWCFAYQARIRRGNVATLPDMIPTLGSLAHELVEEVICQEPLPDPEAGATLAGKLFDERAPLFVATLFQDGQEGEQVKIRNTIIMATRSLLRHFKEAGVKKLTIEQHLTGRFQDQELQGWADVVAADPFTVIDLKRSYSNFFRKKMNSGTALQIVIYGWLLKQEKGLFPELGYFTLEDQTFLTTDTTSFPDGEAVKGPPADEVWQVFEKTWAEAWKLLTAGNVFCNGGEEKVEAELSDDRLVLPPPCKFCDYDVLCGRRFI